MAKTPSTNPKMPKLESFLLADHVYKDVLSGKMIIAGTFNGLLCKQLPSTLGRSTFAYLRLTNCRGPFNLQLRYEDLENNSVLLESSKIHHDIDNPDPLAVIELVAEVPSFPMPHEGWYEFGAYCNDEFIGRMRINVRLAGDTEHDSSK